MGLHIGRHWSAIYEHGASNSMDQHATIEEECPCPVEPCGLIDSDKVDPDCPQHSGFKTLRSMHDAKDCPGVRAA